MDFNVRNWLARTKRGQVGSATSIAWAIGYACIIFVVMAYTIAVLASSLQGSGLTTVAFNNTVANTSGILTQLAPLLLPVGIIAMVAIVLLVLRVAFGGGQQSGQRSGM